MTERSGDKNDEGLSAPWFLESGPTKKWGSHIAICYGPGGGRHCIVHEWDNPERRAIYEHIVALHNASLQSATGAPKNCEQCGVPPRDPCEMELLGSHCPHSKRLSHVDTPINQCDGCRRGLPIRSGIGEGSRIHYGSDGVPVMLCTKERYQGEQSGDVGKSETPQGGVGSQKPRDGSTPSALSSTGALWEARKIASVSMLVSYCQNKAAYPKTAWGVAFELLEEAFAASATGESDRDKILCDAVADAARYEEIKEILLTGGSVSYSGGSGEYIIRDIGGNESRCSGGLASMLDERIARSDGRSAG